MALLPKASCLPEKPDLHRLRIASTHGFRYHEDMLHLHTRSCCSFLESPLRPEQIVQCARNAGMTAAAITDHDAMYGVMEFYHACRNADMKPVFGLETEIQGVRLLVLAKDDQGLQTLYAWNSRIMEDRVNPPVSRENQPAENEPAPGQFPVFPHCVTIALTIRDRLEEAMIRQDERTVREILVGLKETQEEFVTAEAMMDVSARRSRQAWLDVILQDLQLPKAAVSYVLYEQEEDAALLQVLRAIAENKLATDLTLDVAWHRQFRTLEEMQQLYSPEAMATAQALEDRLHVTMSMQKSSLPPFSNRLGLSSREFLVRLAKTGLNRRLAGHVPERYRERLEYELDVITRMGFTDYFLIVYDMIRFARSRGMLTGPGRGSAAGSLVAWSLGITHIDPISSGLLFERFLNPERITMPDIDTDFPDDRRDEVVQYLRQAYGQTHVAQIAAFSNLKARAVLRDVAKAFGVPSRVIDPVTRLIPNMPGMTMERAWQTVPRLRILVEAKPGLRKTWAMARRLEGLPRHVTTHAAGVVLSDQDIRLVAPLVWMDRNTSATQFSMEHLEELGLIKIDVLSLRNLTIIREVLDQIDNPPDLYTMPTDDEATWALLDRADTTGVFQLEKEGIRQLLRQMHPRQFEDVTVVLALYRPGPMAEIPHYLQNRAHPESIVYPHPLLEPVLKETYGVMIYQEQIMETARIIGGFSLGQADILRKAMSKKQQDVMGRYREQFLEGALVQGIDAGQAAEIFSLMEKFAGYGFNKSHSYAYGRVAWAMAWLKANHPLPFYQSILNHVIGAEVKTGQYLYECRQRRIPVLGPDIRVSSDRWQIENGALRMPLTVMKGIGTALLPRIVEVQKNGEFPGVIDTIARLWAQKVNESQLRVLVDGGAFDFYGINRATLRENMTRILNYAHIIRVEKEEVLFDYSIASEPTLVKYREDPMEKSTREKAVFGFYFCEHPVQTLRKGRFSNTDPIAFIQDVTGFVRILGRVASYHPHKTKKGDLMCFVTVEDETGQIDLAVMPDTFARQRDLILEGTLLYIQGKKDRPGSVLVRSMEKITSVADTGSQARERPDA